MIFFLKKYASCIFLSIAAFLFIAFQLHQLVSFNPYWGYDGGAHVHILETLLYEHRFLSIEENYLAWHEPLYYLFLVGFGFLSLPFWVGHFFVVLALDGLVFLLWKRMGHSSAFSVAGTIATLAFPAFLQVSMFYTNEALNYVFLLAIMHAGLSLWREEQWSWRSALFLVASVGLGVVTKITALVAFGVVAILLMIKIGQIVVRHAQILEKRDWVRVGKYGGTIVVAVLFSALCYAPWYAVRSSGLSQVSINNYDMLPAKPLVFDERVHFMTRFDLDIFEFPFWYSGGAGFWSMLYADTVSDYLGIFEHQDKKHALPAEERIFTTHNGTSVSAYRKPLAMWALRLGFVPVFVMAFGMTCAFVQFVRERGRVFSDALPVLGFGSAFLLALMYYAYRYPYYDQGVVKSIFIAPAFVLPLAFGVKKMQSWPWFVRGVVFALWGGYFVVVLALFFIR